MAYLDFIRQVSGHIKLYRGFPFPVILCDTDFHVQWSNPPAKTCYRHLTEPEGIKMLIEEIGAEQMISAMDENGSYTARNLMPFTPAAAIFHPVYEGGTVIAFCVMIIRDDLYMDSSALYMPGNASSALTQGIRKHMDGIFASMDDANLKSIILDHAVWLSPHLNRISADAYKILRYADNIDVYSQMQNGSFRVNLSGRSICHTLNSMSGPVSELGASLGIPVEFIVPEDDIFVAADMDLFSLALYNIIHNSFVCTNDGNEIRITAELEGADAVIRIADKGYGIPEDIADKIFTPFYSYAQYGAEPSAGLGLTVARRIILAHKGSLSVDSKEGKGTVATIILPAGAFSRPTPLCQADDADETGNKFSRLYTGLMGVFADRYGIDGA